MIQKLHTSEYERIRPLFEELRYNLVIDSVIDGNTPGWVYTDDVRGPRTVWMWNRMDAMLLAGRGDDDAVNHALATLIRNEVIPDAKRRYISELSLHYFPESWESKMSVILRDLYAEQAQRRFYTFERSKMNWREQIPAGCQMRCIDEELLANTHLQNIHQVIGWVRSFWASHRDFVQRGFGFCLLQGETIASWCLSVYVSGEHYELGLAAAPDYQRRGFATLTALACVQHCVDNSFTPHWHCWEDNLPSIAVAEKVGFEKPTPYTVYRSRL